MGERRHIGRLAEVCEVLGIFRGNREGVARLLDVPEFPAACTTDQASTGRAGPPHALPGR